MRVFPAYMWGPGISVIRPRATQADSGAMSWLKIAAYLDIVALADNVARHTGGHAHAIETPVRGIEVGAGTGGGAKRAAAGVYTK